MTAQVLDGKDLGKRVRRALKARVPGLEARLGRPPALAVVLVGDDPASQVYVGMKERRARKLGVRSWVDRLDPGLSQAALEAYLQGLADDPGVDGILLQLPLPGGLDADAALARIPPGKDVDGLTLASLAATLLGNPGFRPCTPKGVVRLLEDAGFAFEGAEALVIGRSRLVGKPLAAMLTNRNCTVTLAHSRSRDLATLVGRAQLVVAAAGRRDLVEAAWLRPGSWVVDVGIHRLEDGSLAGDVEASAAETAAWLTPVPGGVGPMTIAMLLENVVDAAEARLGT